MYGNVNPPPTEGPDGFRTPTRYARPRSDSGGRTPGGRGVQGRGNSRGRGNTVGGRGRGQHENLYAALEETTIVTPHQRKAKSSESDASDADTPIIRNGNGGEVQKAIGTQLTSVNETSSVASDGMKTTDADQESLPSTSTTKSKRRKRLPRRKGSSLAQLSDDGKKIMTTFLAIPIDKPITTELLKNTSMKEGVDILLSIAARRAYQHTGFSTERCAPQWRWKPARDLLNICNDPEAAAAACGEPVSPVATNIAANLAPKDISQLVGHDNFQKITSATPPDRKGMETILKVFLARMYPADYISMLEDMTGSDDKMLHRLLTVPGAIHNYCAIAQTPATFSPPQLCDIEQCLPLEFDRDTNLPMQPMTFLGMSDQEIRSLVHNSKTPLVAAFDGIIRQYQRTHHYQIMLQIKQLTAGHLVSLAINTGRLAQFVKEKNILPPLAMMVPEEMRTPQATTSTGSTQPNLGRPQPATRHAVSHDIMYRFQISTHGDKENATRPAHHIAATYLQNLLDIVTSLNHHLHIHPTDDSTTTCISDFESFPKDEASWASYMGSVRTSVRKDGVSFEVILRSGMSLPHLLRPGYIEFDDETAEHTMFLQCKRIRVEPISQHRFGFIPVMMAINSSANDGPARVKTEIIQRAADLNHKLKYTEFDVAWYRPTDKNAVPSLVLLTHPSLAGHLRAVVAHLGSDANRGKYPATYDYEFGAAREEDHASPTSYRSLHLKQKQFLINRRFIVLEGIHPEINLDQIIPPIEFEWAEGHSDTNCLSVAQLLIQHPRLFRDSTGEGYSPSPFTKVQRSLTESKWYLQTTGKEIERAQQIATYALPKLLKSWLNHWETANMCIRTGISPDKLYSSASLDQASVKSTSSVSSDSLHIIQKVMVEQQELMKSQQDQITQLLTMMAVQRESIKEMSTKLNEQVEIRNQAHTQMTQSLHEINQSLQQASNGSSSGTISKVTDSTGLMSLQESADRFKSMLDTHSATSTLTDPDQSLVHKKLDDVWKRLADLPTSADLYEIGEWMRLTLGCCNKTQVACQQSRQLLRDGREDIQQFCESVRADEMEHLSHILSSINAFLQVAKTIEQQTNVPMDVACTILPPPTKTAELSTPTKRIMDLQETLMERLDTATSEMAQINADHTRRENYLERRAQQQLCQDDSTSDQALMQEEATPADEDDATGGIQLSTTATSGNTQLQKSDTSSADADDGLSANDTASTPPGHDIMPQQQLSISSDAPQPPAVHPATATNTTALLDEGESNVQHASQPAPKWEDFDEETTVMGDDTSDGTSPHGNVEIPSGREHYADDEAREHASPANTHHSHHDTSPPLPPSRTSPPEEASIPDSAQGLETSERHIGDASAGDTNTQLSGDETDNDSYRSIVNLMYQKTSGLQARNEARTSTTLAQDIKVAVANETVTQGKAIGAADATPTTEDASSEGSVIENMEAVMTTARASSSRHEKPTCQQSMPQFQDLDLLSDAASSSLPPAAFSSHKNPLPDAKESPTPSSVITRRQAKATNASLFPALMHANPKFNQAKSADIKSPNSPIDAINNTTNVSNSSVKSDGRKN